MPSPAITPTTPTADSLLDAAYPEPDYRDAYLVDAGEAVRIEDFATGFFLSQPSWLAKVSMNLGGEVSRRNAISEGNYPDGSSVGSWRVHGRSADEIMFGEHMGFMAYRFSMLRRPDGRLEAGTSVKCLKRLGPIYFAIVKPFHRGFIRVALRNAAKHAAVEAGVR